MLSTHGRLQYGRVRDSECTVENPSHGGYHVAVLGFRRVSLSRRLETKTAVLQNLAMRRTNAMTPGSFVVVCSALMTNGYTVTEIIVAFDSLVSEQALDCLPRSRNGEPQ